MPCDTIRDYEWEKEQERKRDEDRKKQLKLNSKKMILEQSSKAGWTLKQESEWKFTATKPYSNDKIEIEILDSGTVRTSTDKISPANHMSAERFLMNIQGVMGGKVTIRQKLGTPHSHGTHMHTH